MLQSLKANDGQQRVAVTAQNRRAKVHSARLIVYSRDQTIEVLQNKMECIDLRRGLTVEQAQKFRGLR